MSLPLFAFGGIFIAWWSSVAFVVGIDPLDLYPWGMAPTLPDMEFSPDKATPYLVDVAAKDKHVDTIVIGGSTSQPITREMMTSIFPDTRDAFNLSYNAPRTGDRALVTREVAAHSTAKRVLLAIDYIYVVENVNDVAVDIAGNSYPTYLYDNDPFNDIRTVGLNNLRLATAMLLGRPYWLPDWDITPYRRDIDGAYKEFQTRASMTKLARRIVEYKGKIDSVGAKSCDDLPAIREQLVPFARQISQKHAELDVFFPPMSLATYYDWFGDPNRVKVTGTTFMSDYLLLQRCVVGAFDGITGVRIFGFDNEDWLTGDLEYYWESSHPYGDDIYRYLLHAMVEDTHRLTAQNIDGYSAELRQRILNYSLRNSNLPDLNDPGH